MVSTPEKDGVSRPDPIPWVAALRERATRRRGRIVFARPDGADDTMLSAAVRCGSEGLVRPVVLGDDPRALGRRAARFGKAADTLEILAPGPVRKYRDLWRAEWAASGISPTEADESLGIAECFGQALLLAGDADAMLIGHGSETSPSWVARRGAATIRFVLGFRESWCLLAVKGGSSPSPSGLAEAAVSVAALARRITGEEPELRFMSPTVPVTLRVGPRFRSAGDELARYVEEAIATVRIRMPDVTVADFSVNALFTGAVERRMGALTCIVLTHGGEDLARLFQRGQGPGWVVGPLSVGPGGVRGDCRGLGEEGVVDLAVLASLSAG